MSDKTDAIFQALADRLVEAIENDPGNWSKPWREAIGGGIPGNAVTGNGYKGGNVWALAFSHPRAAGNQWATYKQWESVGCQVRKGQHGVGLIKWFVPRCKVKHGRDVKCGKCPRGLFPQAFTVFHAEQAEIRLSDPAVDKEQGLAPVQGPRQSATVYVDRRYGQAEEPTPYERLEAVEAFIAATDAAITHSTKDRAFYSPKGDFVNVPEPEQFETVESYYGTLLHELTHWTGHRSRCNRVGIVEFDSFGSEQYGQEELIAELGAVLTGEGLLGIPMPVREDHAQYLASWVKTLKASPKALYKSLTKASEAANHLASYSEAKVEAVAA